MMMRKKPKEEYTAKELEWLADELDKWIAKKNALWIKSFAIDYGIPPNRFKEIMYQNPYSEEAYERALAHQEKILVQGSLYKKLDVKTCLYALEAVHGWGVKRATEDEGGQVIAAVFGKVDGTSKELISESELTVDSGKIERSIMAFE
jgi:hypothetical protein